MLGWSSATPLSKAYCASQVTVRGNLVPATHGETVDPLDTLAAPAGTSQRLRMPLSSFPLAHLDPGTLALAAAPGAVAPPSQSFTQSAPRSASTLVLTVDGVQWTQVVSLLDSGAQAPVYRVEIDDRGAATVVFGLGGTDTTEEQFGLCPPAGSLIVARYRAGGGTIGNVSAGTLVEAALPTDAVGWFLSVTNPLPATGGRDLESRSHARRFGPPGFKSPLVAVTVADYEAAAKAFEAPDGTLPVQRSNAAFRWTGSWLTVTLGVEAAGQEGLAPALQSELLSYLDTRRIAGYDLEIDGPSYLPIDLIIAFCTRSGFLPAAVQQGIAEALSNQVLAGGGTGLFYPGNFTFGSNLYVSAIYAAVMSVPGVESARINRLARLHADDPQTDTQTNLRQGFLAVGTDQIVQLDNDRNFPERGTLTIQPLD